MENYEHILNIGRGLTSHGGFIAFVGFIMYFSLKWSMLANSKGLRKWKDFRRDQADEMRVTIIWGLAFLVLDDEIINAFLFVREAMTSECSMKELLTGCFEMIHIELPGFFYLFTGFVIDRVYIYYLKFKKIGEHK